MKITHASLGVADSDETGKIQPSDIDAIDHAAELEATDITDDAAADDLPPAATAGGLVAWLNAARACLKGIKAQVRTPRTATLTIYVRTDGNDANDGLADSAARAVKTWTGVFNVVEKYDTRRYQIVVRFGAGEFAGIGLFQGFLQQPTTTYLDVVGQTDGSTIFTSTLSVNALPYVRFQYVTFRCRLNVYYASTVALTNCKFEGTATPDIACLSNYGSRVIIAGGVSFTGKFTTGIHATRLSSIEMQVPVTFGSSTEFSTAFAIAGDAGGDGVILLYTATFTGSFTGKKFSSSYGGKFQNRTLAQLQDQIPGTVAGTAASGNVVVGGYYLIPTPTAAEHAANKGYVDTARTYGGVGSYVFASCSAALAANATTAGSTLTPAQSGTWRAHGTVAAGVANLFCRVA